MCSFIVPGLKSGTPTLACSDTASLFQPPTFPVALHLFHQIGEQQLQAGKTDAFARARIFQRGPPAPVECLCAPKAQQVRSISLCGLLGRCGWVAHLTGCYQARVSPASTHRQDPDLFFLTMLHYNCAIVAPGEGLWRP